MDIFFVRHGETEYNRKHRHQPDDAPLNAHGREQAQAVAASIPAYEPTHLITSTMLRARETTGEIEKVVELEATPNVLFIELQRPRVIYDQHHFSPRSVWYMLKWFFSHNEAYWDKVGGESRLGFLLRIREAKYFLETLPEDARVVVVSHSIFINFFIEHICNEARIPFWKAALLFLKVRALGNTSVTQVRYDPDLPAGTCKWSVERSDARHI